MTSYDDQAPGVARCHGCGRHVLFAIPEGRDEVIALDPDDQGVIVAWQDGRETARCRPDAPGYQLALGEYLFRPHDPSCTALAAVRPIGSAPSRRCRRPHPAVTPRRASAR